MNNPVFSHRTVRAVRTVKCIRTFLTVLSLRTVKHPIRVLTFLSLRTSVITQRGRPDFRTDRIEEIDRHKKGTAWQNVSE